MNRFDPPAIVRSVTDLNALAVEINAAHRAGEESTRRGLQHFRAAGEALLKAKKECGHGHWLPWLDKNVRFSARTARAYMRVANEWEKLAAAANLSEALRLLTEDDAKLENQASAPAPDTGDAWEGPESHSSSGSEGDPGMEPYIAPGVTLTPKAIASVADAGFLDQESVAVLLAIRNDYGDQVVREVDVEWLKRHRPQTGSDIYWLLNAVRPLDHPTLWPFPSFTDSPQDAAVEKAGRVWYEDAISRGGKLPHWEIAAFWFAAQTVRLASRSACPVTSAQLARCVSVWRESFQTALAWFITDGFDGKYTDFPDRIADPEGSRLCWGYHSDLRHAGALKEATALRITDRAARSGDRAAWTTAASSFPGLWASFLSGLYIATLEDGYPVPSNMQGRLDRFTVDSEAEERDPEGESA